MPRFEPLDISIASARIRELTSRVEEEFGMVPNIFRCMAASPALLDAFLSMSSALSEGELGPGLRERISLLVAQKHNSEYCLAAHTAMAAAIGLSREEIIDARKGASPDRRISVLLDFVKKMLDGHGNVDDLSIKRMKKLGFTRSQICEIIGNVGLSLFSAYFNLIAETEMDFPRVQTIEPVK